MCIAIYKPATKDISKRTLKTCFDNNNDGCGFAYINEDYAGHKKIIIKKSMDFDSFYSKYQRALLNAPNSPFLIHFRIATHGIVSTFNCHPFKIDSKTVFMHNGIISNVSRSAKKSDTRMFNEEILSKLRTEDIMFNPVYMSLLESFIGIGSKLVFLDIDGNVRICNEKKGNWHDGIWYSNLSWKPKVVATNTVTPYHDYRTYRPQHKPPYQLFAKEEKGVDYAECDDCGKRFPIKEMYPFRAFGNVDIFCKRCKEDSSFGQVYKPFDKMSTAQYLLVMKNKENNRFDSSAFYEF